MSDANPSWLDAPVALFAHCKAAETSGHPTIADVLHHVRAPSAEHIDLIAKIRAAPSKDEQNQLKQHLPAATFAADLHHRKSETPLTERLISWSGVAAMDGDDLEKPDAIRDALKGDPFIGAAFVSPSGKGVKIIVRFACPDRFADCWRAAASYLKSVHGITADPAPKNPASLCFLSHDPDLWIADGDVLAFQPMTDETVQKPIESPKPAPTDGALRPGDDFNLRGNLPALITHHGWTLHKDGPNQLWRRPGKNWGYSATYNGKVFYVFTSSAAPLQANTGYSPFAVLAHLEHGGDFAAAARSLRSFGYGEPASVIPKQPSDPTIGQATISIFPTLQFDLTRFSDTPERSIEWLWPGVIPKGMLSLIGGKQGLGKSYLICDLAARISTGKPMPDGTVYPPGNVLLLTREDDPSCVLLPRLKVSGADLGRVSWSLFSNAKTGSMLDLPAYIDLIIEAVKTHQFTLVVVDTFSAFAPAGTDANAAQDVRLLLDSLTRLARSTGAAVVVIAHLRKNGQGDGDPMDAIAGSAQMTAGVRVAAMLEQGTKDDERWFRVVKSNLGRIDKNGYIWRFYWPDPFTEGASEVPRIEWDQADDDYAKNDDSRRSGGSAPIPPETFRTAFQNILAKGLRSASSACELVWATIKKEHPRLHKSEVELALEEMISNSVIEGWEGPRGVKLVAIPGTRSQVETPEEKALRLVQENPDLTVRELAAQAGCRVATAGEILRTFKNTTPEVLQ